MKGRIVIPGFLTGQCMIGKRASYLNPIRMYLFTSFIFFLVFFYVGNSAQMIVKINGTTMPAIDSSDLKEVSAVINDGKPLTQEELQKRMTFTDSTSLTSHKSREEFDSLEKISDKKTGWLKRLFIYKEIELDQKYPNDKGKAIDSLSEKMIHALPKLMFILLPLFALFLKILYHRKKISTTRIMLYSPYKFLSLLFW